MKKVLMSLIALAFAFTLTEGLTLAAEETGGTMSNATTAKKPMKKKKHIRKRIKKHKKPKGEAAAPSEAPSTTK